jgi:hypothetical protein
MSIGMLNVIMLNVFMLNVVAPNKQFTSKQKEKIAMRLALKKLAVLTKKF